MIKLLKFYLLVMLFFLINNIILSQTLSKSQNSKINIPDKYQVEKNKFKITHSLGQEIMSGNTVSCNLSGIHYQNSYYRVFDLFNFFLINDDWIVEEIDIAIEIAESGTSNFISIILNFYTMSEYSGEIILDNLTNIGSDTVNIYDFDSYSIKNIEISSVVMVPEGNVLVVEIKIPDGQDAGDKLFLGSNNMGQTDSTYIMAPHCGLDVPTDVSEIGYPETMLLMNLYGIYASPNPEIISFNIEGQVVETIIKNEPYYTINLIMPFDSLLTNLSPIIIIPAGYMITPNTGELVDFSQGAVTYTVTNEFSKISQSWEVNVNYPTPDILSFTIPNQNAETIITGEPEYTVIVPVPIDTELDNISPTITIYPDFEITPDSEAEQDFSQGAVIYTVSHDTLTMSQEWTVSVIEYTDIKNINNSNILVYPNPSTGNFIVDAENISKIEVYNVFGKNIISFLQQTNDYEINLTGFQNGIYFLKIFFENKNITKKIIITQ